MYKVNAFSLNHVQQKETIFQFYRQNKKGFQRLNWSILMHTGLLFKNGTKPLINFSMINAYAI